MYVVKNLFNSRKRSAAPHHLKRSKNVKLGPLTITPGKWVTLTDDLYRHFEAIISQYSKFGLVEVTKVGGEEAPKKVETKPEKVVEEVKEPETVEPTPAEVTDTAAEVVGKQLEAGEEAEDNPEEKAEDKPKRKKGARKSKKSKSEAN